MVLEEVVATGVEHTVETIEQVLKNRKHRLAKTIVVSSIELVFTVGSILAGVINETNELNEMTENNGAMGGYYVFTQTYIVVALAMIYFTTLAGTIFVIAQRVGPVGRPRPEIEDSYEATNRWICIGGLLEIPLSMKYGGVCISIFLWGMYLILFILVLISLFYPNNVEEFFSDDAVQIYAEEFENTTSTQTKIASFLALIQAYRITADTCEFWVYQKNAIKTTTGPNS